MKVGTRVEFTREEVRDILVRFARQQLGQTAKELRASRVHFSGENKYLNTKPAENKCRDCGCMVLARTRREPFDEAIVLLTAEETEK